VEASFKALESTITFTPAQGSEAAADEEVVEDAVEDTGAELAEGPAAGVEQAARESRRPAAARELAAAVRNLVKVTCQG